MPAIRFCTRCSYLAQIALARSTNSAFVSRLSVLPQPPATSGRAERASSQASARIRSSRTDGSDPGGFGSARAAALPSRSLPPGAVRSVPIPGQGYAARRPISDGADSTLQPRWSGGLPGVACIGGQELDVPGAGVFLLAAAVGVMAGAAASSASANHSWNGYHWARTSNPFTVQPGDNVSGAWDNMLRTASSEWSKSRVLETTVVSGGTAPKVLHAHAWTGRGLQLQLRRRPAAESRLELAIGRPHRARDGQEQRFLLRRQLALAVRLQQHGADAACDLPGDRAHVRARPSERGRFLADHLHGLLPQHLGLRY